VSLVLDTSLALSWYFEDERTPAADALVDRVADQGATVPGLWRLEIATDCGQRSGASVSTKVSGAIAQLGSNGH
jgi:hypothetical protein